MNRRGMNGRRNAAGGGRRPKYGFPILKPSEIVSVCHDQMEIKMEVADLIKPTQKFAIRVYSELCKFLMGITDAELSQPKFHGLEALGPNLQLYDDSLARLHLFRAVQKLMEACACDNFTLNDLLLPDPDGMQHFLSALINFTKFREGQLEEYEANHEQVGNLQERKEELMHTNAVSEEEIMQLKSQLKAEKPQLDQIRKELKINLSELKEMEKTGTALKDVIQQKKDAVLDLKPKIDQVRMDIQNLKDDNKTQRAQIVKADAPQRLRMEIKDLRGCINKENNEIRDQKTAHTQIMNKERERVNDIKELTKCIETMRTLDIELKKGKREVKALKEQQNKITLLKAEMKEIKVTTSHMGRRLTTCENKIAAVDEEVNKSKAEHEEFSRDQENEVKKLEEKANLKREQLKEMEAMVSMIRAQIADQRERHKVTYDSRKQLFEQFVNEVKTYNENIVACTSGQT